MKKILICVAFLLMLSGCGGLRDMETVGDVYVPQTMPSPAKTTLQLPEDASAQVIQSESGRLYFCEGYEIMVQTLSGGDMDATVRSLTGYEPENLTILQISAGECKRYECVWTSAGEGGDMVGRTVVLDDGSYHYCLSVTASASEAGSLQESWNELLNSFAIQG